MEIATKEPWWELAARAAVEPDPHKLLLLMVEINRLLEANRSEEERDGKAGDTIAKA
jgi:hypothetical protein